MTRLVCAFTLLFAAFLFGCSDSIDKNPLSPQNPLTTQSAPTSNRHLWGFWQIDIAADRQTAQITSARSSEMHLNVVRLLETSPCTTCLKIGNIKIVEPYVLKADLTITHPLPGLLKFTGFDVRGIFISQGNYTFPVSGKIFAFGTDVPTLLNPDGYTSLFNPTEYPPKASGLLRYIPGNKAPGGDLSSTINPFIAYKTDAPRRMFESGGVDTKTVRLHVPSGPIHFGYAIDICWQSVQNVVDPLVDFSPDANCLEAYKVIVDLPGPLHSTIGSQAVVNVEVFDHQGLSTIGSVTLESPGLFSGSVALSYSSPTSDESWLYTGTITNQTGVGHGFYPLLVTVADNAPDQNLGAIDASQVFQVEVDKSSGWARTWGGTDDDKGYGVATDESGNVYVTGFFLGKEVDFNPDPVGEEFRDSNGSVDVFLSKFDYAGTLLWVRTWGGKGGDEGRDLGVDGSGNVYVTGSFEGDSVDFNPDPTAKDIHSSNGEPADIFLSKFDPSGTFLWARTWGGTNIDLGFGIDVDGFGNAYVTGYFWSESADFDPAPTGVDTHVSSGNSDVFVSKFNSSGAFVWARTWGGPYYDYGNSVAVDESGNAFVTGYFDGISVDFDPDPDDIDTHVTNGGMDIFLSKLDSSGDFQWARTWGGGGWDYGNAVDTDSFGNAFVTGAWGGKSVDFDPDPVIVYPLSSNGGVDSFISKFDSSGALAWARSWGGKDTDQGNGIAVDEDGNICVTGQFEGKSIDFNPDPSASDPHSSNGQSDVFLSKFDLTGSFVWARTWGSTYQDEGLAVDMDSSSGGPGDGSGSAFVSGYFYDFSVDFNPDPIGVDLHSSNGLADIFLTKTPPTGNW
jgi:hypothetical protein